MIVRTWASCPFHSSLPPNSDFERLCILPKALSTVVLPRGNINVTSFSKGTWSRRRRTEVDVHSSSLCHFISTLRRIGAWTSCLLNADLALLADAERFGVLAKALVTVVLAWSDVYVSSLSE